jgi:predicted O-methyltransferase YrrM
MDHESRLISVENNEDYQAIARDCLSDDPRVTFVRDAGLRFLEQQKDDAYDFIYADTWPGKYVGFDHSLRILRPAGMIVMDDMLPQPNWPADHPPKVEALLNTIDALLPEHFQVVKLCWFTGHILITKKGPIELT